MNEDLSVLLHMDAADAAKRLIGCELVREFDDGVARVRIVETEAYDQTDAASHSFNGRTKRTDVMFGPGGRLYVYFTYGMHYCMNVVIGPEGNGAAVLIRAVEPIGGERVLTKRRAKSGYELTNGPVKLCQALAIDASMNGHDLSHPPLRLILTRPPDPSRIATSERIGISKAKDVLWRFYEADNPYVSRRS